MEFFIIYLFNVLDSVRWVSTCILFITLFLLLLFLVTESDGEIFIETIKKHFKPFVVFVIITTSIIVLVPTKKDLKWIIGGGIAWKGIAMTGELQGVNELPQNVLNATNVFLETIAENDESETQ